MFINYIRINIALHTFKAERLQIQTCCMYFMIVICKHLIIAILEIWFVQL